MEYLNVPLITELNKLEELKKNDAAVVEGNRRIKTKSKE